MTADPQREWLVANGLGGYAAGTVGGEPSRRYHGALIAALPNPAARVMMLSSLTEALRFSDGHGADLGWAPPAYACGHRLELVGLELVLGLPVWRYAGDGVVIEKRLVMVYGQNTTVIIYRAIEGGPVGLELRPASQFRGHDEPVSIAVPEAYPLHADGDRVELEAPAPLPVLRLRLIAEAATFVIEPMRVSDLAYAIEERRGYASRGQLYSPGRFRAELPAGGACALVASTERWEMIGSLVPDEILAAELERRHWLLDAAPSRARTGAAAELVLAADQFVIRPAGRHDVRSIIAGYHWFTEWGRDTMISLEGLCLCTGRLAEAGSILHAFAHHVRDGLIPNMFPEGEREGRYHTADATLWFFHAIDRYYRASRDRRTLVQLLPILRDIVRHHLAGTRFGIRVDPVDGLLAQGAPGYQLTWMDAKVGDWVITPRRGKAVEINALWYNALRLLETWLVESGDPASASELSELAARVRGSFNQRFWNPQTGFLFDVVDGEHGDDPSCRPNQLFAISLPNAVLVPERWHQVLAAVERELLTPVGLRSLSPNHPEYKRDYHGDRLARDAAYHQGTVWSWLIGPYVDAVLRARPSEAARARRALDGLIDQLGEDCVGFIGEVFDAEPPYAPGGCVAQAWGVAELLRCLLATQR
jgi:predicted glycogen debranching enzyme